MAMDAEADAIPLDERGRQEREGDDARGDHVQVIGSDEPRSDVETEPGCERRPPPAGRHQARSRTGTGTWLRSSSRIAWGVRPVIAASAAIRMRWDITGTTSAFTSSGMT